MKARLLATTAALALLTGPSWAAAPGEIVGPTIDPTPYVYGDCQLDYGLVPLVLATGAAKQPGVALVPATTEAGEPLDEHAAQTLYWHTVEADPEHFGRHLGIYDSEDAAHAAVPNVVAAVHLPACHARLDTDDEPVLLAKWHKKKG